jgi:uncharacterized repeat protein (TIGR01451 family)
MRAFTKAVAVLGICAAGLAGGFASKASAQAVFDLTVEKTGPAATAPGQNITYTLKVTNFGPDTASQVTLTDTPPAGLTFVSFTNSGPALTCSFPEGGAWTCSANSFPVGSETLTLVMNVPSNATPGTFYTNVATVSVPDEPDGNNGLRNPDSNPENNSASVSTQVSGGTSADVGIVKSAPETAESESSFNYIVTVSNAGPDMAASVTWSDTLPGNLTFVSLSQSSGPTFSCSQAPQVGSGGTVSCSNAEFPAGASASFVLTVNVPSGTSLGTTYNNIATVSSATSDPNSENNSSATLTTTDRGATTTTLTSTPNPSIAGQSVTFTATVRRTAGPGLPTGTVSFKDGSTTLGVVPLANGTATLSTSSLSVGQHAITAVYSGDGSLLGSTSPVLTQVVDLTCADLFANATTISGPNGAISGSSDGTTGESGEPNHAGNSLPLNSVWCKWSAPANGPVSFDTTGSLFDTTLAAYTGPSVASLTPVAANDNLSTSNTRSRIRFAAVQGVTYYIAIDGVNAATGRYLLNWAQEAADPTTYAAVLPYARSVVTGTPTTALATILNPGSTTASQCSLAMPPGFPGTFKYQTTNSENNLTGTPNTPVDIPASGGRMFMFAITPLVDLIEAEFAVVFDCANTPVTTSLPGVNTFLLSASGAPTPDLAAVSVTSTQDGIVDISGDTGSGFFVAAAINVGIAGTITATADDNGKALPLSLTICETNPQTGACLNPPAPTVSTTSAVPHNGTIYYTVFVKGSGNIPYDPAHSRLFLRLRSTDGVTRGATNVAVRTAPVRSAGPADSAPR